MRDRLREFEGVGECLVLLVSFLLSGCSQHAETAATECSGTLPEVHTSNVYVGRGDSAWMVLDVRGGTAGSFAVDVTLPPGMWADGGLFLARPGDELVQVWSNITAPEGEHGATLTVSDLCGLQYYDVPFRVTVMP